MKIFWRKHTIVKWLITRVNVVDVATWALNVVPWRLIVRWGLKLVILVLRSEWVEFERPVPDLATFIATKLADGNITDEDAADILEELEKEL